MFQYIFSRISRISLISLSLFFTRNMPPILLVYNRDLCIREEDPPEQMILLCLASKVDPQLQQPKEEDANVMDSTAIEDSISTQCFIVGAMAALEAFQDQRPEGYHQEDEQEQREEESPSSISQSIIKMNKTKWAYARWLVEKRVSVDTITDLGGGVDADVDQSSEQVKNVETTQIITVPLSFVCVFNDYKN